MGSLRHTHTHTVTKERWVSFIITPTTDWNERVHSVKQRSAGLWEVRRVHMEGSVMSFRINTLLFFCGKRTITARHISLRNVTQSLHGEISSWWNIKVPGWESTLILALPETTWFKGANNTVWTRPVVGAAARNNGTPTLRNGAQTTRKQKTSWFTENCAIINWTQTE